MWLNVVFCSTTDKRITNKNNSMSCVLILSTSVVVADRHPTRCLSSWLVMIKMNTVVKWARVTTSMSERVFLQTLFLINWVFCFVSNGLDQLFLKAVCRMKRFSFEVSHETNIPRATHCRFLESFVLSVRANGAHGMWWKKWRLKLLQGMCRITRLFSLKTNFVCVFEKNMSQLHWPRK